MELKFLKVRPIDLHFAEKEIGGRFRNAFGICLILLLLLGCFVLVYAHKTSMVAIIRSENSASHLADIEKLSGSDHEDWGPYRESPDFSDRPFSSAMIAYRSVTGSGCYIPKYRTWDGKSWSHEFEAPAAQDNICWVEVEHCPVNKRPREWILAATDIANHLNYYVWNGNTWKYNSVKIENGKLRCFDIAYERTSGDALLTYSKGTTDPELYYKVWNGEIWSTAKTLDLSGSSKIDLVRMTSMPDPSDEIVLAAVASNSASFAKVWYKNGWGDEIQLSSNDSEYSSTQWSVDIAYEQDSFDALVVYNNYYENRVYSRQWNREKGWGNQKNTGLHISKFNELAAQSGIFTDNLLLANVNDDRNYERTIWDGDSWREHDVSVQKLAGDRSRRSFDIAWDEKEALFVCENSSDNTSLVYQTWTPGGGEWSDWRTLEVDQKPFWIEINKNPRKKGGDNQILGAYLGENRENGNVENVYLYGLRWDGSNLYKTSELGIPKKENQNIRPEYRWFDLAFEQKSEDDGNLFMIRPVEKYHDGLWIQVELADRKKTNSDFYFFTEKLGIYRATSDKNWDEKSNWKGPIQERKLTKRGTPVTFQISSEEMDEGYPFVIALDNWYYRMRGDSYSFPAHVVTVEEASY